MRESTSTQTISVESSLDGFDLELPKSPSGQLDQDEEWCVIKDENGERQRIRFHDYNEIYSVPGLYECIFYDVLRCASPKIVTAMLQMAIEREGDEEMDDLIVFDVGAGNGMVGEELKNAGVESVVGVDIIQEAKDALDRDRPKVYDNYFVADLTDLTEKLNSRLAKRGFNCLVTVAALGFGDIPPLAFVNAFNFVGDGGWIAFNIKEDFLKGCDSTGFARLIRRMMNEGILEVRIQERYRHRLGIDRSPLFYAAVVGRKTHDIPEEWLDQLD